VTSKRAQDRHVASRLLFKETLAIGVLPVHHQGFCSAERRGLQWRQLRLGQSRRASPRMCYFTGGVMIWSKSMYSKYQEKSVSCSTGSSLVHTLSPCHSDLSAILTQSVVHMLWSNKLALAFLVLLETSTSTRYLSFQWIVRRYGDISTHRGPA
jgi:hypothetical protein